MQIEKRASGFRVIEHYKHIEGMPEDVVMLAHSEIECECGGKSYRDGEKVFCSRPACRRSKEYMEYLRERKQEENG